MKYSIYFIFTMYAWTIYVDMYDTFLIYAQFHISHNKLIIESQQRLLRNCNTYIMIINTLLHVLEYT